MACILDGKKVRDEIREQLKSDITKLVTKPTLVIIQVGSRPDSAAFIKQKKIFADYIGAVVIHKELSESVLEEEVVKLIQNYNADASVHGIILQIPLPPHLNKDLLLEKIDPKKDVDGLTSYNTKLLFDGRKGGLIPATARGIVTLLTHYKIPIRGKNVTIVGRSNLVGKPVALAMLAEEATITIAHKETKDLKVAVRNADIVIIAIGDPEFITGEYVSPGQVVVDVGINSKDGAMVGDVLFKEVESIVAAITPVPGGVGPMTVTSLFQNLLDAYDMVLS